MGKKFSQTFGCTSLLWDGNHFKKNPEMCGNTRYPAQDGFYEGRPDLLAQMGGFNGCCKKEYFEEEYRWQSPSLASFNAKSTCEKLGKRKVLFIGDSTVLQTATTLMNALFSGGCQTQIQAVEGDTLMGINLGHASGRQRGNNWVASTIRRRPHIVIISAGAHIFGWENFTRVIDFVISGFE
mmetsp:Transcript_36044/g.56405  ORF Transcript_36044/g.56405 Transcript_36044/m.56405 type:complete len:182 (-) Transcript_36044:528-1073(-)